MILKTDLLPYQQEAYDKLCGLKIGALYMEMGTGKTRTALELIKHRIDQGKVNHVIWLCPCSIKGDIRSGIAQHSDLEQCGQLTICGIETLSTSIRAITELADICQTKSVYLIVDESSKVKNHAALRSKHITELAAYCPYRLILNGTPVSKSMVDLYSQWYLLDWRILGYKSFWSFSANHIEYDENNPHRIRRVLNVDYLTEKIAPYTYQITKAEVLSLPNKKQKTEYFCLTDEQENHYFEIADALMLEVDEMAPATIYRLLGALQAIISGYAIKLNGSNSERYRFFPELMDNPRNQALMRVIRKIGDEKAIIFCSFVDEINEVSQLLPNSVIYDGETTAKEREVALSSFRSDTQYFISSKGCGSFGLNLQHCHNIIYYSNDWDWGTRAQSEDRVHRIGQDHEVKIYDLCASGTIDERILSCLNAKEQLSDSFKAKLREGKASDFIGRRKKRGKDLSDLQCV